MKMVMDERLKHRLVGIAVVLSLGAIFVPAILKNSSQRLHDSKHIAVRLPNKPQLPRVDAKNEEILFKRMTVAHVDLPKIRDEDKPVTRLARARPLSPVVEADTIAKATTVALGNDLARNDVSTKEISNSIHAQKVQVASLALARASTHAVMSAKPVPILAKKPLAPIRVAKVAVKSSKLQVKKPAYTVQLGLFSQQQNALALIGKLKGKGYQGFLVKVNGRNGTRYKVFAGRAGEKQQAKRLQQQLASAVHVNGFVVSGSEVG